LKEELVGEEGGNTDEGKEVGELHQRETRAEGTTDETIFGKRQTRYQRSVWDFKLERGLGLKRSQNAKKRERFGIPGRLRGPLGRG